MKTNKEEKELNEMLDRINEQDKVLRAMKNKEEPYKHLIKQEKVIVDVKNKKDMMFWGE